MTGFPSLTAFAVLARVLFALILSSLVAVTPARSHEVQPGVMDIEIEGDTLRVYVEWMIEAAVGGIDLDGIQDTNDAANEDDYLRLRALPPDEMAEAFRAAWPDLSRKMTFRAGDTALDPELAGITVPEVGNVEVARISTVELTMPLPAGDDPLVIGWTADLGPLIVRQRTVEDGYAGFLTSGDLSDPIPRRGATEQGPLAAFLDYVSAGFDHIVPMGLDHILFVLGLFFLSLRLSSLLWQVTAFTLAHTVTLALGALDVVRLSPDIVEPLIAASIVYVGVENILVRKLHPWRPVVVFCFGLLHGLGFASVLQDFGLSAQNFVPKLIGFNVGVELGQLAVIAAAWLTLGMLFGEREWYHRRIAAPVSAAIALIAAFWVLDRTGVVGGAGPWSIFSNLTEGGLPALATALSALALVSVLTALVMAMPAADDLRDAAGMATSATIFLAIIATFTAGAWGLSILLALIWPLALRFQALGGPEPA